MKPKFSNTTIHNSLCPVPNTPFTFLLRSTRRNPPPMAAGLSAAALVKPSCYVLPSGGFRSSVSSSFLPPLSRSCSGLILRNPPKTSLTVCFVLDDAKRSAPVENPAGNEAEDVNDQILTPIVTERTARKRSERSTYLVAAVMSTLGITSMAVLACYYRFYWQMEGGEVPLAEMFCTFSLSVGAAVGMEFWARWAHKALWHASLWHMHESHHRPREGPFELNDVFAIINAVPAIGLLSYGFFNKGLFPGLCFGAGLGITVFGIAYMFVHDGLVHKRFPVGPIANVPYFRKVAAAHQLHHTEKFNGVPYGLFMGPKELEEVGGLEELEKEINRRIKSYQQSL